MEINRNVHTDEPITEESICTEILQCKTNIEDGEDEEKKDEPDMKPPSNRC